MALTSFAVDRPFRNKLFHRLWPSTAFLSEVAHNPRQVDGLTCSGFPFLGFRNWCISTTKCLQWLNQSYSELGLQSFDNLVIFDLNLLLQKCVLCLIFWWLWPTVWDCICSAWIWFFFVSAEQEADGYNGYRRCQSKQEGSIMDQESNQKGVCQSRQHILCLQYCHRKAVLHYVLRSSDLKVCLELPLY